MRQSAAVRRSGEGVPSGYRSFTKPMCRENRNHPPKSGLELVLDLFQQLRFIWVSISVLNSGDFGLQFRKLQFPIRGQNFRRRKTHHRGFQKLDENWECFGNGPDLRELREGRKSDISEANIAVDLLCFSTGAFWAGGGGSGAGSAEEEGAAVEGGGRKRDRGGDRSFSSGAASGGDVGESEEEDENGGAGNQGLRRGSSAGFHGRTCQSSDGSGDEDSAGD